MLGLLCLILSCAGNWTKNFMLARQVLYQFIGIPSLPTTNYYLLNFSASPEKSSSVQLLLLLLPFSNRRMTTIPFNFQIGKHKPREAEDWPKVTQHGDCKTVQGLRCPVCILPCPLVLAASSPFRWLWRLRVCCGRLLQLVRKGLWHCGMGRVH